MQEVIFDHFQQPMALFSQLPGVLLSVLCLYVLHAPVHLEYVINHEHVHVQAGVQTSAGA